ncbi:CpsD/CapB family tyrosine-protein kinase [Myxococcota bacterium]|nr:CpsD/CapB family tyrosine-protein kinase [Myxococcota bacterium]MCZ7619770.1 CpsD/CapB family tyrosine-protein kinase [Myxococcota bacterium]
MGEITEALRRGRENASPVPERASPPPVAPESPAYREALREETRAPAPDPPPEQVTLSTQQDNGWFARALVADEHGAPAESFRELALRVRRELDRRSLRGVAVVSALRAEGKTTVACNLALALASLTRDGAVALVDLDLRNPSVRRSLGLPRKPGVDAVLRGETRLVDVRLAIERPGLDVYQTGRVETDVQGLLVGSKFVTMLRELERRYEITVFDTPPTLLVPDAAIIVEQVRAALAVSRAGLTGRRSFAHAVDLLTPARVLGCVLNEGTSPASAKHYGEYYGADHGGDPSE